MRVITNFCRRLKVAWRAFCCPSILDVIEHFEELQRSDTDFEQYQIKLRSAMSKMVCGLLPNIQQELPIELTVKTQHLLTAAEADEILKESRSGYQYPLDQSNTRIKLAKHNDIFGPNGFEE